MSFLLLFKDELKGFYKSKVMIFLWIGLPLLALFLHISISNDAEGFESISLITSLIVSNIGGLLSSVMLSVNIINEKDTRVYDLFLIRPIKRWHLLVSKFLAIYLCVSVACILAISLGIMIDYFESQLILDLIIDGVIESFIMSLCVIAISSAVGILIGVVAPSIVVGVILVIFVGNYVSTIPSIIPFVFSMENTVGIVLILGIAITIILMFLGIFLFNKKEF